MRVFWISDLVMPGEHTRPRVANTPPADRIRENQANSICVRLRQTGFAIDA